MSVPTIPILAGVVFRPYRGQEDHPAMVELSNELRRLAGRHDLVTREQLDNLYAHLPHADLSRDCVVAELGGRPVAYGRVEWNEDTDGGRIYETIIVASPRQSGRGLEEALISWGERRLTQIDTDLPPVEPRLLGTWAFDAGSSFDEAVSRLGYTPVRRFFQLVRPDLDEVAEAVPPDGLQVRPVRPEHWRAIWEADHEAFRDHWGEIDDSEESYQRFLHEPYLVAELWQVAWDGDQVAGAVLVMVKPAEELAPGEAPAVLESVYVRRPWRKRGLARALILRSLAALREAGITSAALDVDSENPNAALGLYESCGFRVVSSATAYRKPFRPASGG